MMQLLKNVNLTRYLKNDFNVMNITKNVKHEKVFSIQLKENNQIANSFVKNLHIHERIKHIDVAYHHVRNLTKNNLIQLNYIFNNEMMTNEMTKSLSKKIQNVCSSIKNAKISKS